MIYLNLDIRYHQPVFRVILVSSDIPLYPDLGWLSGVKIDMKNAKNKNQNLCKNFELIHFLQLDEMKCLNSPGFKWYEIYT